jgi:hypothetical protein
LPDDGGTSTLCACPRAGEGPDAPPARTKVLLTGRRLQLPPASVFGRVYDALVALAAKEHGAALATRDVRARGTYDAVCVEVIIVT